MIKFHLFTFTLQIFSPVFIFIVFSCASLCCCHLNLFAVTVLFGKAVFSSKEEMPSACLILRS